MTEQVGNASHTEPEYWQIERACSGAVDAYDGLITRHRARAVRLARALVGDKRLAEDMAKEAFIRTLMLIRDLRSPEAFQIHLTREIFYLYIDYLNKTPYSESIVSEDTPHILTILDVLPSQLRLVIVLRDVHGMDYQSITKTLRWRMDKVLNNISQARAILKSVYANRITADEEA